MTHEQYLDEPADLVDWMIAISDTERQVIEDKQRREQNARR
jgi:hypothetical protein